MPNNNNPVKMTLICWLYIFAILRSHKKILPPQKIPQLLSDSGLLRFPISHASAIWLSLLKFHFPKLALKGKRSA